MKREFLQVKTRGEAIAQMLWASKIVKVDGGYLGFESIDEYEIWCKQK